MNIIDEVTKRALKIRPCGSRVTCDPAPTDTDIDYIVLVGDIAEFQILLYDNGFLQGGSSIADECNILPDHERFLSFVNDEKINFIITTSAVFYDRFVLATDVCKTINELRKPCRIVLFQAILYSKAPEIYPPLPFTHTS